MSNDELVDFKKQPLLEDKPQQNTHEIFLTDAPLKNPCDSKKISIGSDYYSLTWACLRISLFEDKTLRGEKIYLLPSDYFALYFDFLLFIVMLGLTIVLVVRNVVMDDLYKEGTLPILACRCILMVFAMKSIGPEFSTGYAKYLYAMKRRREFTYPAFAKFVGLCQVMNATIAILGVLFFVCTADQFGDLLTNFSGICVLTELDDWIGDMILIYKLKDDELPVIENDDQPDVVEEKTEKIAEIRKKWDHFNLKDLNERLSVIHKMAMIEDKDLEIFVNDELNEHFHWTILWFDKINDYVPWEFMVPILTIPLSYAMPYISEHIKKHL